VPNPGALVLPGRNDAAAVRAELGPTDAVLVLQTKQFARARDLPNMRGQCVKRAIETAHGDSPAVRAERNLAHIARMRQRRGHSAAGGGIPNARGAVVAGSRNEAAVRAEAGVAQSVGMLHGCSDFLTGERVPN